VNGSHLNVEQQVHWQKTQKNTCMLVLIMAGTSLDCSRLSFTTTENLTLILIHGSFSQLWNGIFSSQNNEESIRARFACVGG